MEIPVATNMASTLKNNLQSSQAKRPDFRTTREGVLPNSISSLGKLTLDAAMKAALTHAGAKLVVEMDAGGTRVLLADGRTNQLIGGPEDLQKLGSIRAFVNRERKDAAGVEAAKDVTQLAFLANKVVKDEEPAFEMKPVDNSYGAAIRPMQSALHQMVENKKRVEENSSDSKTVYGPIFHRLFKGIANAYALTICALTKGQSIKGQLNEHLLNEGVPEWVHTRFISKNFVLERTGDLSRLLFPSDPTKGLAFTVKEWRSNSFLVQQEELILSASTLGYQFTNDSELLRAITGIAPNISLEDEENPLVSKMLKAKLVVMPPAINADRVIEIGSKSRSGFKFPNPTMDTITGSIVALSTALLRVYSANLQSVDLVGDYYATIAPGAVRREDVTPTNNFYVQWGKAADPSAVWREAIKGAPTDMNLRKKLWRWLRTELRLSEAASAGKALADVLLLEDTGEIPSDAPDNGILNPDADADLVLDGLPASESLVAYAKPDHGVSILRDLKDTELPFWIRFQERVFPSKAGKKKAPVGLALTPVTPEGKRLLSRVYKLSPYVADRMLGWLRSFSDERLQLAAIKVTNAEFDDLFSSTIEVDDDDAESVTDWAETEA